MLMNELSAERVDHAADDLTTGPRGHRRRRQALTPGELASFLVLLLTAGNKTTRTTVTHGMSAFADTPTGAPSRSPSPATVATAGSTRSCSRRRRSSRCVAPSPRTPCSPARSSTPGTGDPLLQLGQPARVRLSRTRSGSTSSAPPTPASDSGGGPHFCLGAHLARRKSTVMMRGCSVACPTSRPAARPSAAVQLGQRDRRLPCRSTPR